MREIGAPSRRFYQIGSIEAATLPCRAAGSPVISRFPIWKQARPRPASPILRSRSAAYFVW